MPLSDRVARAARVVAPIGGLFVAAVSFDFLEARADEDDDADAAHAAGAVVATGWSGPPDLDVARRAGRFAVVAEWGEAGRSRPLRLDLDVYVAHDDGLVALVAYAAHVHDAVAVAAAGFDADDGFDADAFADVVRAEVAAVVPAHVVGVAVSNVVVQ